MSVIFVIFSILQSAVVRLRSIGTGETLLKYVSKSVLSVSLFNIVDIFATSVSAFIVLMTVLLSITALACVLYQSVQKTELVLFINIVLSAGAMGVVVLFSVLLRTLKNWVLSVAVSVVDRVVGSIFATSFKYFLASSGDVLSALMVLSICAEVNVVPSDHFSPAHGVHIPIQLVTCFSCSFLR